MDLISSNSPTIHSASNVEPPTSSILSRKRTHSITSNHSTNSNLKPSSSPPSQDSSSLHSVHSTNSSLPRPSSILTASSSYFSLRAPAQLGSPRYFPFLLSPLPPGITWTHVFVLALACSVIFGNYYCYDLPASLNVSLQDQLGSTFDTFQYQLNLLYTVYSLPNIVLPLISGYLVDTLGVRRVMMVLATLVVISAIGFATSYTVTSFIGLVVSRFMLGVGGESLEVVSATVLSQWFQSTSWMTLAFALQLSSSRLATVVQDNVTPLFITRQWTEWACWCSVMVTLLSWTSGFGLLHLDRRRPVLPKPPEDQHGLDMEPFLTQSSSTIIETTEVIVNSEASSITLTKPTEPTDKKRKFKNPFSLFSIPFWTLCLGAIVFYGSVIPFIHIASAYFQTRFNTPVSTAGFYMAIPDTFSAIGTPLFGVIIDRLTYPYPVYLVISSFWASLGHLFLHFFTNVPPWVGMGCLGVHFALFPAALWPSVALLVSPAHLGLAFGWLMVSLNIGLAVLPLIVAPLMVIDASGYLFLGLSFSSFFVGSALMYFNQRGRFKVQEVVVNNEVEVERHLHEA